ncbi:uncharacterized protein LOC119675678 [Teleopsis dalmanni]|uniref:uncharacterized protein LOC119675678 n=1 Tax=Teleopsis dalmanni TaxID=139649 RepID=UPI0018CE3F40|nr:uncharacterized protein LOC119675678 [Teleopsis dalmanni]
MISRRDKLLNYPWEQQRYEQHKRKVHSAKSAVDVRSPPVYLHVLTKPKKMQKEKERLQKIETENVRLLQKLGEIMTSKRVKNFWLEPRPNFLGREKLFETRPYSSLPKLITIYGPSEQTETNNKNKLKQPTSKGVHRCPTCSGNPERTLIRIPEIRLPHMTPCYLRQIKNKSEEVILKRCMHCGHPK